MHWGHMVSKDLIRWVHMPVALAPDHDYDCGGEFSGSMTLINSSIPVASISVACGKVSRISSLFILIIALCVMVRY